MNCVVGSAAADDDVELLRTVIEFVYSAVYAMIHIPLVKPLNCAAVFRSRTWPAQLSETKFLFIYYKYTFWNINRTVTITSKSVNVHGIYRSFLVTLFCVIKI